MLCFMVDEGTWQGYCKRLGCLQSRGVLEESSAWQPSLESSVPLMSFQQAEQGARERWRAGLGGLQVTL